MPDIQVNDLTLRYSSDVTAVNGLSLQIEGGKIYGLLGRNGAGKSSFLSMLAAFRKPTSGEILVGGRPVFENPLVTSQICLIRDMADTVEDDEPVKRALEFAAYIRPNWDQRFADSLVERFELPLDTKIQELSRGKRAALSVILGLASRAPLTMFDESYLGMDAPSRYIFYDELLADFSEHPRTIIISTHLIEEVASLFEEVIIIDKGRLLLHEDTDMLRARGATVIGLVDVVDRFVEGLTVLNERQLGSVKSAVVYGQLDDLRRRRAGNDGLDIEPVALQDLFVHITESRGDAA